MVDICDWRGVLIAAEGGTGIPAVQRLIWCDKVLFRHRFPNEGSSRWDVLVSYSN